MDVTEYPVEFWVEYPDRKLNRLTTFFRIFMAIPISIILIFLIGGSYGPSGIDHGLVVEITTVGLIVIPTVFMLLFRRKYPKWWFDWNLALTKFNYRVLVYLSLMTDIYPSTDEEQSVDIKIQYPDAQELNRWLPLVKWIMVLPHAFVLAFLGLAAFVVVIIAWFAILFTGRYPVDLFNFVAGVYRWELRVYAYAFILATDIYPPFSLSS